MLFSYAYQGSSAVRSNASRTHLSFAPDTSREPTYFRGTLSQNVSFREAISALHDVVISDLRFKPKDRSAYKKWVEERGDLIDWQEVASHRRQVGERMKILQAELRDLDGRRDTRSKAYYDAQRRYYDYLYKNERDTWFVLDPVITVHPDELFFECFSQDESSYGRLGANYEVFKDVGEFACGTTNIDYSSSLYDEFQKIRSYKNTDFTVDPSGFTVATTGSEDYKEVKIDLPDSWVRGFLQVNAAMCLPAHRFELHPMDLHNLCFVLRRHREKQGPRSMRYCLAPGQPVKVVFDPWGTEVVCPRSIYHGTETVEVRVWGRRRIHILERLIPLARRFTVHLLGHGLPSFYVADLGPLNFTLGLSGWTANDWSHAGSFDLMAPRATVDLRTSESIFAALRKDWRKKPDELAAQMGLDRATVLGALSSWTQAGRAIYDLNQGLYRARELSREPLPIDRLRFSSEREEKATALVTARAVRLSAPRQDSNGALYLSGTVRQGSTLFQPNIQVDGDERLVKGDCSCSFFRQNKLMKGPCDHMLALRIQHSQQFLRPNLDR